MGKILSIDGASGGGQILRTSLALALLEGRAVRVKNIRTGRPKPGLQRQHLACVKAAAEISDGALDGAELGSTEVIFHPGKVRGGDYHFAIGTAGSSTLLLQTVLLPLLLRGEKPSTVLVEGGTHNPMAPTVDYLQQCFLPVLSSMGAELSLALLRHGFAPAGGGAVRLQVAPLQSLKPVHLPHVNQTSPRKLTGKLVMNQIPEGVAERTLKSLRSVFLQAGYPEPDCEIEMASTSVSSGIVAMAEVRWTDEGRSDMSTAFGSMGRSSESLGAGAAKGLLKLLASGASVGPQLADQLQLPFALAGAGSYSTVAPDEHFVSNRQTIAAFLEEKFALGEPEQGRVLVSVV